MSILQTPHDFLLRHRPPLASALRKYLAGTLTHADVRRHVDGVFSEWSKSLLSSQPEAPEETAFWCTLWAAQHLASPDHWSDGTAQRELGLLTLVLEGTSTLPANYTGHRS